MGLTALYTGANGMKTLSTGMQVVGNNLANVNTVGFKQQMAIYQDMLSTGVSSASVNGAGRADGAAVGYAQLGMGVSMAEVRTIHRQGSFDIANEVTDLGIGGIGFFGVSRNGVTHYTRAGNFRFDKSGYLTDPSGFRLQGKPIVNGVAGGTGDLRLDINQNGKVVLPASPTQSVRLISNLGSVDDLASDTSDPFFSLAKTWDGTQEPPLGNGAFSHSSTMRVYDADGNARDLTIYFDAVNGVSNAGGNRYFEYIVTMPPSDDGRSFSGAGKGLLLAGTLTFGSGNTLTDMTAFVPGQDTSNLSSWAPASFSAGGLPQFDVSFLGQGGGAGGTQTISLDLGVSNPGGAWTSTATSAGAVGNNAANLPGMAQATPGASNTTAYNGASSTLLQRQDGYGEGYLQNLSIGRDGVMTGKFSNGESADLFQISIYRFTSEFGLKREGGNHFSATNASGAAQEGVPASENYGYIAAKSLEQSNVDMATEFVNMIVTQRGFQSNSKIITTQDQMIQHALQMKR
ncbi:flagellar hook protein FlgE [Desulfovibrio psychrotolerans]|uniref:Flagellar hook protein FlgE n=1 Tax=Desulfovibrio psychrotolerans TaxID=415242 RepID=A0A7J0BY31_9BACT|nr:flagellar hook-basal body complex protein [Desulfovibrio psychrotolerans]GFM38607.1 flagellar hook protein FlgE [Desulfovibrio psychrotolerans]